MLEDLSLALPRLSSYKKTAPTDPDLDGSLLEIYTEFICFHARAIQLFRSHKHGKLSDVLLILSSVPLNPNSGPFEKVVARFEQRS